MKRMAAHTLGSGIYVIAFTAKGGRRQAEGQNGRRLFGCDFQRIKPHRPVGRLKKLWIKSE